MSLEYNPFAIPLVMAAVLLLGLAVTVWPYRAHVGERIFSLMSLAVSLWTVAFALELMAPEITDKLVWIRVEYVGIALAPFLLLWFSLRYTNADKYMGNRKWLFFSLLLIIPCATIFLVWTSDFHPLFYAETGLEHSAGFPNFAPVYGPWFWVHVVYSYILIFSSCGWLVRVYLKSTGIFRKQISIVLAAVAIVIIGNFIYIARLAAFPIDYTPYAFAFACIPVYWGLFRYHLFDISPVARDQVFESITDAVLTVDSKKQIVDVNLAAETLFQQVRRELIGTSITDISSEIADLVGRRERTTGEVRFNERYFNATASPVYRGRKQAGGYVLVLHDITLSRLAEQALRESETRYRGIVEDQSELICRWNTDSELTFANEAFRRFFQAGQEELIGLPFLDYLPDPEKAVVKLLYTTRTPEKPVERYEYEYVNRQGRKYWIDWRIRALFDETGAVVEYQAVGTDISKRKKSEEALLERRRTMHLIFSSMPNTLLVLDETLQIESFLVPADIKIPLVNKDNAHVGASLTDVFINDEVNQRFLTEVTKFQQLHASQSFEMMFEHKEETYYIGASVQSVTDSKSVLVVIDDITEIKRAEAQIREYAEELEERNAELDTFTRTVAHDLKAPLASIVLYADFLLEYEQDMLNNVANEKLEKILDVASKMGTMIDDLLTLARLRSAQREVVEVDMDLVAKSITDRLRALIDERQVEVDIQYPLFSIMGHEPWLEQVLANLVGNAIKYIGEDNPAPKVTVRASRKNGLTRYEIIDNGPGIPEEAQRKAFNMFTRFDRKTTGHGLGLSIVARIIEKLEGTVGLESEVGIGSTFWFEMPTARSNQHIEPSTQIDHSPAQNSQASSPEHQASV